MTSLYAAVTIGKSTEDIINELARQSKNVLPQETVNFIEKHTRNIGKLELVDSGAENLTLIVYDEHIAHKMSGSGDLGSRLFELGLRKIDSDGIEDAVSNSEAWKREFDEDGIMRSNHGITTRFALTAPEHCTQICKVLLECASPSLLSIFPQFVTLFQCHIQRNQLVRLQERHHCEEGRHATSQRSLASTLPRRMLVQNFQQRACSLWNHRAALWRGKDPCWRQCRISHSARHGGPVQRGSGGAAMG